MSDTTIPQLPVCLVVDSGFRSRRELFEKLRRLELFHEVIEALSLEDGVEKITQLETEACIIGATVSPEKVRDFIDYASRGPCSASCAFLVLERESAESDGHGAHVVLKMPFSDKDLADSLVAAVVRADPSGTWAQIVGVPAEELLPANGTIVPDPAAEEEEHEPQPAYSESELLCAASLRELAPFLEKLENGIFTFKPDGSPSLTTQLAVQEAIEGMLSVTEHLPITDFASFLELALYRWLKDREVLSDALALQRLKSGILAYFEERAEIN